jgi:hypothetical protein
VRTTGGDPDSAGAAENDPDFLKRLQAAIKKGEEKGDWTDYKKLRGFKA